MNILIINQPIENRGDEAAHRSLIRTLIKFYPAANITVIFIGVIESSLNQMKIDYNNITYINIPFLRRGIGRIFKLIVMLKCEILIAKLYPLTKSISSYIMQADIVMNAPGGICMGLFQNWQHLFWLRLAKLYRKKVFYYSRSFGPFPVKTISHRIFKKISIDLLKYCDFISIRDAKTMEIAEKLGLRYIPSIDTAFLDTPKIIVPIDVRNRIGGDNYIVYVPNSLIWQPSYISANATIIDNFYMDILISLLIKYKDAKIIMMPQLFNSGVHGDIHYFEKIKNKSNSERVIVLPETYSSDIQQSIISNARLVVGARYHSIVFAINNNVPFIALSYEHKIAGLLEILKKEDSMIDISDLGFDTFNYDVSLKAVTNLISLVTSDNDAKVRANNMANNCFLSVMNRIEHF